MSSDECDAGTVFLRERSASGERDAAYPAAGVHTAGTAAVPSMLQRAVRTMASVRTQTA